MGNIVDVKQPGGREEDVAVEE